MSVVAECRIYENSKVLKDAMTKVYSSIRERDHNIILINISYSNNSRSNNTYSGMEYILKLRSDNKDTTPVLFYGFEEPKKLKKKTEASILKSPAIEYIRLPFKIKELSEKIQRLSSNDKIKEGLDKQTRKDIALNKIAIFKHDIVNAANTVKIVYKLRRSGSDDIQRKNRDSVKKSIFKAKDLIDKKINQFENIRDSITELMSKKAVNQIEGKLLKADSKYNILINNIEKHSDKKKNMVLSDAEEIVDLLHEIVNTLEMNKV